MKENKRSYFLFTKKERRGIMVLLFLIFFVMMLPYCLKQMQPVQTQKINDSLQQEIAALPLKTDSTQKEGYFDNGRSEFRYHKTRSPNFFSKGNTETNQFNGRIFLFDPNNLGRDGWLQLGVSEKTAATIQKYTAKGGRFRTAEDLRKIFGLAPSMAEKLIPFVRINDKGSDAEMHTGYSVTKQEQFNNSEINRFWKGTGIYKKDLPAGFRLDINQADTNDWKKLPGIGPKISSRIVNFRNKLGGFYSVEQVAETFGLPDSSFRQIKHFLICNTTGIQKLYINTSPLVHPYLPKTIANHIVQYRLQHGKYQNANDLQKLFLIDEHLFRKLLPYISVE
jgi:competence ComEA-like helix-hairpin-helix protein